ncbi:MAG: DUF4270 domain-containing protein [Muribaculaceae bacterium]|nr:DUF4270 domain-containing protein [Muribaculaceae bacterium]
MKRTLNVLFAVVLLLATFSCTDDTIGGSLSDTRLAIIEDSSFTITGQSVPNTSLRSRTTTQLLGVIKSDGYGTLSSSIVTQFMPVFAIDTAGTKVEWIDSCKLVLRLPTEGAFTGDSLAPMKLNVYRLNKSLPSPIYSDFDASGYYDVSAPVASVAYSNASAKIVGVYDSNTYSYIYHREVEVPVDVDIARSLYTEYVKNPETFRSPSNFEKYFPGVAITNSFGSGRVMNFTDTEFRVYCRKHVQLTDTTDTIYKGVQQTYLASSPEVLQNNLIRLDVDQAIKDRVAAGEAIVQAPAGYEVKTRFPIQEVIDMYKNNTKGAMSVINSLSFEVPVEELETQYAIAPPAYLLMVKTSKKDEFIEGDSLTNSKDSFYAKYDPIKKVYNFSGMRNYILDILTNKGGVASEDDTYFTITPMDVTIYTDSSSSYYYYYQNNPTTTVTKISPQVSCPAIARLRLDKAKVKVVFSKQSMM